MSNDQLVNSLTPPADERNQWLCDPEMLQLDLRRDLRRVTIGCNQSCKLGKTVTPQAVKQPAKNGQEKGAATCVGGDTIQLLSVCVGMAS